MMNSQTQTCLSRCVSLNDEVSIENHDLYPSMKMSRLLVILYGVTLAHLLLIVRSGLFDSQLHPRKRRDCEASMQWFVGEAMNISSHYCASRVVAC